MLDFRMYTFLTLSQTLSYTKAAQRLCISQPAVSQHIKYLEEHYQVKLFTHDHQQLALTKQGKLLQNYVRAFVVDEVKINELLTQEQDTPQHYRFGATRTIGEYILPKKLSQFMDVHSDTTLSMIVENTSTLIQMLEDGQIDFAFVEGYFNKLNFTYHSLSHESFIAIKGKNYPLKKQVTSLQDLFEETLLIREEGSGTREILERVLHEQNHEIKNFHKVIEIGNIHALKELVLQSQGITFLYECAVQEEINNKTISILDLNDFHITREFNFITLKESQFTSNYESFYHTLFNQ